MKSFFFRMHLAGAHFAVSASIIACIGLVFWMRWYASPAWYLSGADRILLLLICVDVFIGPFITLIIANPEKSRMELVRDLLIVVFFQVSALIWGVNSLWQGRPLYMVFAVDRFELVQASQFPKDLPKEYLTSDKGFSPDGWRQLNWVWANPPKDGDESQTVLFNAIFAGVDISIMPVYYAPLFDGKKDIRERALSLQMLLDFVKGKKIKESLSMYENRDDIIALPAMGRERSAILLMNKNSMTYIDYIDINPFEITIWPQKQS